MRKVELAESVAERTKKFHVALPLRITYLDEGVKTGSDLVCTYDVDSRGARVVGARESAQIGQTVMVERGRNKALFEICWIADPGSDLRGQFGIECIEPDKLPWKAELGEFQETYVPIESLVIAYDNRSLLQDRRRGTRYPVQAIAELLKIRDCAPLQAQIADLSPNGCRIIVPSLINPGSDIELKFRVFDCEISLQGEVRHADVTSSGVIFRGIRRGDKPILESLLRQLSRPDREAAQWNFEVAARDLKAETYSASRSRAALPRRPRR